MKHLQRPPHCEEQQFSCQHLPYETVEEMVVQVRPPSTVLRRDEEAGAVELMAQPTVSEIKSSWTIFLKLPLGESFVQ